MQEVMHLDGKRLRNRYCRIKGLKVFLAFCLY